MGLFAFVRSHIYFVTAVRSLVERHQGAIALQQKLSKASTYSKRRSKFLIDS
uniref:hypothetical protein n=1 Tax=Hassallia byssoidea TaxID=482630 RepID=UPI001F36F5ED|nr:hypothetical protein [Hassalia byssoidea]